MVAPPLQIVDSFLFNYNIGDVLLPLVVLGAVGIFFRRSNKLLGIHLLSFGLLYIVIPGNLLEPKSGSVLTSVAMYKFLGLGLLVLAPVVYAIGRR